MHAKSFPLILSILLTNTCCFATKFKAHDSMDTEAKIISQLIKSTNLDDNYLVLGNSNQLSIKSLLDETEQYLEGKPTEDIAVIFSTLRLEEFIKITLNYAVSEGKKTNYGIKVKIKESIKNLKTLNKTRASLSTPRNDRANVSITTLIAMLKRLKKEISPIFCFT
jgi:hypothetical protein